MALILKQGETYEDKFGNVYPNAYAVIDQNNGNKKDKIQHIVLEVYKDQQARQDKKQPIDSFPEDVNGEIWESYFAPAVIAADKDHYHQAYLYLLSLEVNTGTEEEPVMVKKYAKWESDEV